MADTKNDPRETKAVELCTGCGKPTEFYEYVGVGRSEDGKSWEAYPICKACHHEPPRPLKLHYFHVSELPRALGRAGSSNLG